MPAVVKQSNVKVAAARLQDQTKLRSPKSCTDVLDYSSGRERSLREISRHETHHPDFFSDPLCRANFFRAGLGQSDAGKISAPSRVGHGEARQSLGRDVCRLPRIEGQGPG